MPPSRFHTVNACLPLHVQIRLITNNDAGYIIHTSVVKNFVSNDLDHIKAGLGRN